MDGIDGEEDEDDNATTAELRDKLTEEHEKVEKLEEEVRYVLMQFVLIQEVFSQQSRGGRRDFSLFKHQELGIPTMYTFSRKSYFLGYKLHLLSKRKYDIIHKTSSSKKGAEEKFKFLTNKGFLNKILVR